MVQGLTAWHLLRTSTHLASRRVGRRPRRRRRRRHARRPARQGLGCRHRHRRRVLARRSASWPPPSAPTSPSTPARADLKAALEEANGGQKVDVVLEMVGGPTLDASLAALAPFGRLATFGMASRQPTKADRARRADVAQPRRHRLLARALLLAAGDAAAADGRAARHGRGRHADAGRRRHVPAVARRTARTRTCCSPRPARASSSSTARPDGGYARRHDVAHRLPHRSSDGAAGAPSSPRPTPASARPPRSAWRAAPRSSAWTRGRWRRGGRAQRRLPAGRPRRPVRRRGRPAGRDAGRPAAPADARADGPDDGGRPACGAPGRLAAGRGRRGGARRLRRAGGGAAGDGFPSRTTTARRAAGCRSPTTARCSRSPAAASLAARDPGPARGCTSAPPA